MRDAPASRAARLNVSHSSVIAVAGTPGSIFELCAAIVTEAPKRSLRVKRARISAAAILKALWPEVCSGKGGVMNVQG